MPFNSGGNANLFDCVTNCVDCSVNPISVDYSVDYNVDCEQHDICLQPKVTNFWHYVNTDVISDNANCMTKGLDCNYFSDGFNLSDVIKDHVNNSDCLYHNPDYSVCNVNSIAINNKVHKQAFHAVNDQNLNYLDSTSSEGSANAQVCCNNAEQDHKVNLYFVSNEECEAQGHSLLCDPLFPASIVAEPDVIVNSSCGRVGDYYCNSANTFDLFDNNFNSCAPQAVTLDFCGQSTGPSLYHLAGGDSTAHPCVPGVGHIVNNQCVNSGFYNNFNSGEGSLTQLQASFVFFPASTLLVSSNVPGRSIFS
jgi:hypothetical protein